ARAVPDEVRADGRAAPLGLGRLAPTVIISRTARAALVDSLRAMGYAPVAESAEGAVLVARADARRADPGAEPRGAPPEVTPEPHVADAVVRAMRAGDRARAAAARHGEAPEVEPPRSPGAPTPRVQQEANRRGVRV